MAARIDAGSLVCMSRRVIKGQGIVLQRVKNINEFAEFDLSLAWLQLHDKSRPDYHFKPQNNNANMILWSLRRDLRDAISEKIIETKPQVEKELLKEFWSYNSAHSYLKRGEKILKPKTDFTLVMWTKAPSDYGDKPCKWFVNKKCWHHTKMLKQIT